MAKIKRKLREYLLSELAIAMYCFVALGLIGKGLEFLGWIS